MYQKFRTMKHVPNFQHGFTKPDYTKKVSSSNNLFFNIALFTFPENTGTSKNKEELLKDILINREFLNSNISQKERKYVSIFIVDNYVSNNNISSILNTDDVVSKNNTFIKIVHKSREIKNNSLKTLNNLDVLKDLKRFNGLNSKFMLNGITFYLIFIKDNNISVSQLKNILNSLNINVYVCLQTKRVLSGDPNILELNDLNNIYRSPFNYYLMSNNRIDNKSSTKILRFQINIDNLIIQSQKI